MANNDIITKIEALADWEALLEEAKEEVEALRDELKAEMLSRNTEELEAGQYIIRYQTITNNRFDNSAFKKALPEVYASFIKQTTTKRFTISA